MKPIKLFQMLAAGEYQVEGATPARIGELGYKAMQDKATGKAKDKPNNVSFCVPFLVVPTTGNADCDALLQGTVTGLQDDLIRALRAANGNADEMMLEEAKINLAAVLVYASERASSMKLTEAAISQWFVAEGADAVAAHWYAAKNFAPDTATPEQAKQLEQIKANSGAVFAKLAAPSPDVSADVARALLAKLAVLDAAESSPMTNAIRRKLNQRIEAEAEAKRTMLALGVE